MKCETILYYLVLITLHPSGADGALASSVLPAEGDLDEGRKRASGF